MKKRTKKKESRETPDTQFNVLSLTYRELQKKCKDFGLSGKGTTTVLQERLSSHVEFLKKKGRKKESAKVISIAPIAPEEVVEAIEVAEVVSGKSIIPSLTYHELQKKCKEFNLPSKGTVTALQERLEKYFDFIEKKKEEKIKKKENERDCGERNYSEKEEHILYYDPAQKHMAYCDIDINRLKICNWGKFSIQDSTNEGSCKKLLKELDNFEMDKNVNYIIAHEHQPNCNIKTITICGQLQMYFVIKRTKEDYNGNVEKIIGHHAKHKIKYYQEMPGDEPMPWERLDKLKKGYYKTKQVVVEQCRRILKQNDEPEWFEWFESQSKLDDIADSLAGALSYLKMNKLGKFKNT